MLQQKLWIFLYFINNFNVLQVSRGLHAKYGDKRVIDTPITEVNIVLYQYIFFFINQKLSTMFSSSYILYIWNKSATYVAFFFHLLTHAELIMISNTWNCYLSPLQMGFAGLAVGAAMVGLTAKF